MSAGAISWVRSLSFIELTLILLNRDIYETIVVYLPFTSSVVRFGCIVNVYRMGLTLLGRVGNSHGNGSPFVAIGLNGSELL